jgi:hypothetical protein
MFLLSNNFEEKNPQKKVLDMKNKVREGCEPIQGGMLGQAPRT